MLASKTPEILRHRVDMRRGVNGCSQLVTQARGRDRFGGQALSSSASDATKPSSCGGTTRRSLLLYQRPEGRFPDPQALAPHGRSMVKVMALLKGLDLSRARSIVPVPASRVA